MISTTGREIRNDGAGYGTFGASRGSRTHDGIDELCKPGQWVVSPIDGLIKRRAYPYADKSYGGVLIQNANFKVKIFYFEPDPWLIGKAVKAGDRIGIAQDITLHYPNDQDMQPHIHVEAIVNPLYIRRLLEHVQEV